MHNISERIDARVLAGLESSPLPVALVTGASSGIGQAIARDLARDHVVLAVGRDRARLAVLRNEFDEGRVLPLVVDLARVEQVAGAFAGLPRLNVLVHDAAWVERSTVEDAQVADWRRAFDVNVVAPAELSRVVLPQLRAAQGTVVFVSSGAARRAVPFHTVYSATKHALLAVADGLRQQVAQDLVRVATVAPGPTRTPGGGRSDEKYPNPEQTAVKSEPETVARSVRHVIAAPADSQITELWVRPRS